MNKTVIAILIGLFLISVSFYIVVNIGVDGERGINEEENGVMGEKTENNEKSDEEMKEFISCLEEAGLVIYGSATCPACAQLADSFGGYEKIDSIYTEYAEEKERHEKEKKTRYVPEIQIKGELYEGRMDLDSLGEITGCSY